MEIIVETGMLANSVNGIRQIQDELQKVMDDIEYLVLSVNGGWQGNAEKAYAGRIVYVKKEYDNIIAFFDEYSKLLSKFKDEYDIQDDELFNRINSI